MQNVKLLIVDDDEDDFLLARDLLDEITRGPYFLDWAPSYEQGSALLQKNRHDLCLMDYQLGSQSGIDLLREAQSLGFTGPIILLTGMHQGEVDMQALEAGAVDYLVKDGLTAEQLARSIRYALARREMEQERVERLRAEAENRSKSEFLAHLSHELRTPLSAILGFTELLINTSREADVLGHLKVVHRNGKHLLGLLNDILDLSKIEAGKLELEPQTVYLSSFITDAYFLMHGSAVDKNLQLRVEAPDHLPRKIITDPTRLRQVLLNLMGNAIKFTDHGEVVLHVSMCQKNGRDQLRIIVRDTGIGICQTALESIFQPFVQSKNSYAEPRAGTGLGLAISRQLVERLGGDIRVTSESGRGSEFIFTVDPGDLVDVEWEKFELTFDLPSKLTGSIPRFTGKVLVVDDLRDIRMLVGHFVAMTGVSVSYAKNGEDALRVIDETTRQGQPFDMVLMDIHMPVMGGMEAARRLREQGFDRPLIALTAAHMKGDMDNCLAAGFTRYLSKPVDQHQMHECLSSYLPAENSQAAAPVEGVGRVLLVEDDPDARAATSALLVLMGVRVAEAGTGAEAISCAEEFQPQLILVDLNLPDMDGYTLARQLNEQGLNTRIVVLSGTQINHDQAKAAGISESLLKPIGIEQLQQIL